MHKIRVGVIRGGPSSEYDISLATGATVLNELSSEKYHARDILIDRAGVWHVAGLPMTPHEALTHIDVAFNALHGSYGEDGRIQHIFETHGIPFTGSGSFASVMAMNKDKAKEIYKKEKLKTPSAKLLESLQDISKEAHKIFHAYSLPIVVKPRASGSSFGTTIIKNFKDFDAAVKKAFEYSNAVLVEEFINGKEVSSGVIEGYRNMDNYVLLPVEVSGILSDAEKREVEEMSLRAHKALGLSHYSTSDFIIHPKRGVFILETDSLPPLSDTSVVSRALHKVGAPIHHFLDHIVELAISKK